MSERSPSWGRAAAVVGAGLAVLAAWRWAWPPLRDWITRFDDPKWVLPADLDGDGVDEAVVLYRQREADLAVAFDLATGERRWEVGLPGRTLPSGAWGQTDGVLFIYTHGATDRLNGLDASTGASRWSVPDPESPLYSIGCGGRIYRWESGLTVLDAHTGAAVATPPPSAGRVLPRVVCGTDGAAVHWRSSGGAAERFSRKGERLGVVPRAQLVYAQDGTTHVLEADEARWAEGSPPTETEPRAFYLSSWARPDGSFVTLSYDFFAYACDTATPRTCRAGPVDPALPLGGSTQAYRGEDGMSRALVMAGRYLPLTCGDPTLSEGDTEDAPCILDLDALRLAGRPATGARLGWFESGRNAAAIGDHLQVLPVSDTTTGAEGLAVFDTRTGRYARVVAPERSPGVPASVYDLTVGRRHVFGHSYAGDQDYVFAFDPANGTIPWSEPPGLAAVELPDLLAKLPAAP